jgi:serine phosphatase RsbU (regulator of sigma subunit)
MALDNAWSYRAALRAEQQVRLQLGFTQSVTASLEEGLLATDADGVCTFANPACTALLGAVDPVGQSVSKLFRDVTVPHLIRQTLDQRISLQADVEIGKAALDCRVAPFVDGDVLAGAVVALRDITHRKRAEREREEALAHQRMLVETLAQSFLGKVPPLEGVEVAALYNAARSVDRVGGDYFDFISFGPKQLGIVMGDVCGKGVEAAVYTAMAKYMLRGYARENPEPAYVMPRLNLALYNEMSQRDMFVTLLYAVLDLEGGTLTYVNAGHPAALLYDPGDDTCTFLEHTAGIVGGVADMPFGQRTVAMRSGATVALFTDGVTEAGRSLERPDAALTEVMRSGSRGSAEDLAGAIFDLAVSLAQGHLQDDVAIVVLRQLEG